MVFPGFLEEVGIPGVVGISVGSFVFIIILCLAIVLGEFVCFCSGIGVLTCNSTLILVFKSSGTNIN